MKCGDVIYHGTQGLDWGQFRKCEAGSKADRKRWRGGLRPPWWSIRWRSLHFPQTWASWVGHSDCGNEFVIKRMEFIRSYTANELVRVNSSTKEISPSLKFIVNAQSWWELSKIAQLSSLLQSGPHKGEPISSASLEGDTLWRSAYVSCLRSSSCSPN